MTDTPPGLRARVAIRCERLAEADWFNVASFTVILVNAIVLGLETYGSAVDAAGGIFHVVEYTCLACFAVELLIRFGAHLTAPFGFFRNAWNVFDLVVVLAPLLPGIRENVALLRLVRLARIVRAFRLFPSLRVILGGIRHSLPGLGSFLLIAALMVYVYAMVGWMAFGDAYPAKYGTVGQAMLTLFLLLSLDGITDAFEAGRLVSDWSVLYYISYIIVASYLLTNLLVGVVLKALEEAHESEASTRLAAVEEQAVAARAAAAEERAATGAPLPVDVDERLAQLRAALDALERDLARERAS